MPWHRKCCLARACFHLNSSRAGSLSECLFLVPSPWVQCSLHPSLDKLDPVFQWEGRRSLNGNKKIKAERKRLGDSDCAGKLDFRQWEFKWDCHKCNVEILPSVRNPHFCRDGDSSEREDAIKLHPAHCGEQKKPFHSGNAEGAILGECWERKGPEQWQCWPKLKVLKSVRREAEHPHRRRDVSRALGHVFLHFAKSQEERKQTQLLQFFP